MIKHAILEGFKNIVRSFWLSATAITVLTVSLGSVAFVTTLSVTVGFTVRNLDSLIGIVVFVKENIPKDRVESEILPKIRKLNSIKSIKYTDKETARKELQEGKGFAPSFIESQGGKSENLAWHYILINPNNSESYGSVVGTLKSEDFTSYWEDVIGDQDFINRLMRFYNIVNITAAVLIIIFAVVSILVMANILRITIYSHRDEIEIMRLVGATNNYIRGPFIAEGLYYNLIAAVIVASLFIPTVNILLPQLRTWIGTDLYTTTTGNLVSQMYFSLAGTIFAGIIVGVVTTYWATQKYLKL